MQNLDFIVSFHSVLGNHLLNGFILILGHPNYLKYQRKRFLLTIRKLNTKKEREKNRHAEKRNTEKNSLRH